MSLRDRLLVELGRDPLTAAMADPLGRSNFAHRSLGVTSDREMLAFTRDEIVFRRSLGRPYRVGDRGRTDPDRLACALDRVERAELEH